MRQKKFIMGRLISSDNKLVNTLYMYLCIRLILKMVKIQTRYLLKRDNALLKRELFVSQAPIGKRGWKMFYATLRDMVLYLHKDEHAMKKTGTYDNMSNAIRIHHSLATKATDYTKKQHVYRLHAADGAQYLFQTR